MADRLSSLDTSFLNLEDATTPMHVGSVMVFDAPSGGFDYESLVTLISQRIAHVPRYRQRIKTVPGGLANPVWVDDTHFDMSYHVRRSALPRPGSDEQLEELVARIQPRPLDRTRPMWEVYLVEGLAEDRFAIITKTHHSLVDGISAVDIGNVLVDGNPTASEGVLTTWRARPEPSGAELVVAALTEAARTPSQVVETVQHGVADVTKAVRQGGRRVAGDVISTLARVSARPAPESPLNATVGRARRYVMIGTDLEDYRKVRTRLGRGSFADEVTVNDVILATIAGAFRSWLLTRGESVYPGTTIRAMVPVSVHDGDDAPTGAQVTACFVDLPVGEPGPSMRLHQIAFSMRQQMEGGSRRAVSADTLSGLGGFAPADDARPRRPAGRHGLAPALQRRHHQRARPADPALRRRCPDGLDLPGHPARPRAGPLDRAHLLRRRRLLRALRRPRRHAGCRRARPRCRRRPPRAARGPARRGPLTSTPPTGAVCRSPGSTSRSPPPTSPGWPRAGRSARRRGRPTR